MPRRPFRNKPNQSQNGVWILWSHFVFQSPPNE